jgi:acyl dehydratase
MLHLEDFEPGTIADYGGITVDRDEMIAFAREFDAQPMHTDPEAARRSMIGELIASGWFTAALNMRMMAESFILDAASMGSPGVSELKWLKPVRAGDRLRGRRHVLARRVSASRPDRGFVNFRFELLNQDSERVFEQTNLIMFGRGATGPLPPAGDLPEAAGPAGLPAAVAADPDRLPYLDELVLGETLELGRRTFAEADIVRFGRAFDPQPFHVDPVAARASHFGGLIASGWHTAANWMATMVERRVAGMAAMRARGERPAMLGPSPGFRDLRWIRPVHTGDTIAYRSMIVEARPLASRPGWGMARHHNTGTNQNGETVFSFTGAVLWERRPG